MGPVYVSSVISYALAYDAADVMDNDNLATALSAQIQISIALIGIVRKIVLAKRWSITPEKAQKTVHTTTQRGIMTMLPPSLSRLFRTNDRKFRHHCLAHTVFSDTMFAIAMSRRSNRCAQV